MLFFLLKGEKHLFLLKKYTMEIKIRNLDQDVISALDQQAKSQNKSRNEYLREQLTLLARSPELRQQEDKYSSLVNKIVAVVKENTEVINMMIGDYDDDERK